MPLLFCGGTKGENVSSASSSVVFNICFSFSKSLVLCISGNGSKKCEKTEKNIIKKKAFFPHFFLIFSDVETFYLNWFLP